MKKLKAKKTPLLLALVRIVEARDLIDAEVLAETEKGYPRTNWGIVGTLTHYKAQLEEVVAQITMAGDHAGVK